MTTKKEESTLDLSALKRFENINVDDQQFKMTKIGSKRASYVGVGQYEVGSFEIYVYPATDTLPESYGGFINGHGIRDYLRTSPIVKITAQDENSTTFETEGGIYKLEKYGGM